jgi:hypothetical protein
LNFNPESELAYRSSGALQDTNMAIARFQNVVNDSHKPLLHLVCGIWMVEFDVVPNRLLRACHVFERLTGCVE